MSAIEADIVAEGERVLARAAAEGVRLRLLGGVAIRLRGRDRIPPAFERSYADLDFVTSRGDASRAADLLRHDGYQPHVAFNALHGNERMLFFDEAHGRQVDVFVGAFRMSHRIPLEGRIELESGTLPLADLLLTKLQIAELNEKDVKDALAILHCHQVSDEDGDCVNAARIAGLCASDWGLWRTITGNVAASRDLLARYGLPEGDARQIAARIDVLLDRIEREPKSRAWKLRARIGERKRWYETPEEVGGGP
jgi:Uncharacterised nucleotidyltransferase